MNDVSFAISEPLMFTSCLIIHYVCKPTEYISSKICADAIRRNNVVNKTFRASTYFILIATHFIIILTLLIYVIPFLRTSGSFLHRRLNTVSLFLFKKRVLYIAATIPSYRNGRKERRRLYVWINWTGRAFRLLL